MVAGRHGESCLVSFSSESHGGFCLRVRGRSFKWKVAEGVAMPGWRPEVHWGNFVCAPGVTCPLAPSRLDAAMEKRLFIQLEVILSV